jgi:NAD(P)-dependent dehydrogenase (short-subunit alcohol dehydrogenase family)
VEHQSWTRPALESVVDSHHSLIPAINIMSPKIILVTGANRGIGYSIVQLLAQGDPSSTYLVGSRDLEAGETASKELQEACPGATIVPFSLDVTSDASIEAAVQKITTDYGHLDVLVNNAGVAKALSLTDDVKKLRENFNTTYDVNVSSVAVLTSSLLPLLHKSEDPRVIQVGSARGSFQRAMDGSNPATASVAYNGSKSVLNVLTYHYSIAEPNIKFSVTNPGYCKTAFNGYNGWRDPLEGAIVVKKLVDEDWPFGFYECFDGEMKTIPW